MIAPPTHWAHLDFFKEKWPDLRTALGDDVLPPPDRVFAALALPPNKVRVVILGQDPYPTPGHANGLAFSVEKNCALPRSLSNIYKEMGDDIKASPKDGDLSFLLPQGVLLLNTSLTVRAGQAGSHARMGWDQLVREVIQDAQSYRPLAFVLWGKHAQDMAKDMIRPQDFTVKSAHPSPLSARRGFFGSRPFSKINNWLLSQGEDVIDWANQKDAI